MTTRAGGAPFLLLSVRAEDEAADDEYAAMIRFSGLAESSLRRIRLDREPLGSMDLDDWSGIVLGGGPYTFSDPQDVKSTDQRSAEAQLAVLLDQVVGRDFPFLGCCYGIGTLGAFVGATVDRTYSEPVGPVTVALSAAGRSDPLLAALPDEFEAFVGHKEAISRLPPGAVLLASSPTCPVQAFRVGRNVYATQFHPELDIAGMCMRIDVYQDYGYFDPAAAATLKEQVRRSRVVHPPAILRSFVQLYAR